MDGSMETEYKFKTRSPASTNAVDHETGLEKKEVRNRL